MKSFTRFSVFLLLFFSLLSQRTDAMHIKGGDIYFKCLGGGQYQLVYVAYYGCFAGSGRFDSIPDDFVWTVTSSCGYPDTIVSGAMASISQDLPIYCPGVLTTCDYWNGSSYNAPPGTPTNTAVITYTSVPFTLTPGCTFTATMDVGARDAVISNLQNPGSQDLHIETSVTTPADSSCSYDPVFDFYPVPVFCVGQNASFSLVAADVSGDSLAYTLINPQTAAGIAIPFLTGCSPTNPLGAPSLFASVFTFDSTTGTIYFIPTALGDYVYAAEVSAYHDGVLVGTTVRDFQFEVVQCTGDTAPLPFLTNLFTAQNVSGATLVDSTHLRVCPGVQMQIALAATIGDSSQYVIDSTNALQALPGSAVSVTHSGTLYDTATLHITWTPQNSDSGYHYIFLTVKDTICPLPGRQTYAFLISVACDTPTGIAYIPPAVTESFAFSPVPASQYQTLVYKATANFTVKIYTLTGQKMTELHMDANNTSQNIDIDALATGVYFYEITRGNTVLQRGNISIVKEE